MSQLYRPYNELQIILEQSSKQNSQLLNNLKEYILNFACDFEDLTQKLEKLKLDPLIFQDKKQTQNNDQIQFQ